MPRAKKTEDASEGKNVKPKTRTSAKAVASRSKSGPDKKAAPKKIRLVEAPLPPMPVPPSDMEKDMSTPRKAPTNLVARSKHTGSQRFLISLLFLAVVTAGAIAVGLSGEGQIDVVAIVNERNEKIGRGEVRDESTGETVTRRVPVQNQNQLPNGGLRPSDSPVTSAATPVLEMPDADATTTPFSATSTPTQDSEEGGSEDFATSTVDDLKETPQSEEEFLLQ